LALGVVASTILPFLDDDHALIGYVRIVGPPLITEVDVESIGLRTVVEDCPPDYAFSIRCPF
jgi:hypothetical protein